MGFVQIPCVTLEISSGVQPLRGFPLSISTGRLFLFPIFSNLYSLYPFHSYFNCRSDKVTLMVSTPKRNTIFPRIVQPRFLSRPLAVAFRRSRLSTLVRRRPTSPRDTRLSTDAEIDRARRATPSQRRYGTCSRASKKM